MKKAVLIISVLALTGCATVTNWIPSFWDDNQSASIINVRQKVEQIDCNKDQLGQIESVAREIRWFQMYSESKGMLQKDVLRVVEPMKATADDWVKRGEGSKTYCEMKKKILTEQSRKAASVILGRW
jgi:hypothetical protein